LIAQSRRGVQLRDGRAFDESKYDLLCERNLRGAPLLAFPGDLLAYVRVTVASDQRSHGKHDDGGPNHPNSNNSLSGRNTAFLESGPSWLQNRLVME
jgi:hypothetical protein